MQLTNVQLLDSDPMVHARMQPVEGGAAFRRALERMPLRFAFIDGLIEAICPAADEPAWVLNIKRGILSALQNSMDTLDQGAATREVWYLYDLNPLCACPCCLSRWSRLWMQQ